MNAQTAKPPLMNKNQKERARIVDAATDLNATIDPDPIIDVKGTTAEIKKQIEKTFPIIEPRDELQPETIEVMKELGFKPKTEAGDDGDDGEDNGDAEEDGQDDNTDDGGAESDDEAGEDDGADADAEKEPVASKPAYKSGKSGAGKTDAKSGKADKKETVKKAVPEKKAVVKKVPVERGESYTSYLTELLVKGGDIEEIRDKANAKADSFGVPPRTISQIRAHAKHRCTGDGRGHTLVEKDDGFIQMKPTKKAD